MVGRPMLLTSTNVATIVESITMWSTPQWVVRHSFTFAFHPIIYGNLLFPLRSPLSNFTFRNDHLPPPSFVLLNIPIALQTGGQRYPFPT